MTNIPDISQDAHYRGGNAIFDRIHVLDKIVYNFATDDITTRNLTVTGIATFGTSSTTIDGDGNTIQVGTALTIGHTQGLQFHTQNLHSTGFELNQINISGIATVGSDLYLTGALVDTSGDTGSSGQLLASTGSGTNWINANSTSVLNAVNVGVNLNGTNANQFVSFFGASSGNNPNRVDAAFTYNPSTNTMSGINYSGTSTFTNTKVTGIATVAILEVEGQLIDGDGNFGSAGKVLTSDGTDTKWDTIGSLAAGSAAQIAISNKTSGTHRILFSTTTGSSQDVESNTNLTYNTSTQVITGKISTLSNHDTDDLSEGSTNQYFTTARARASVSATGDLSYNSSNGQFSVSVPSAFVSGMIILWSGAADAIPTGFVLCDGNNNTPNLTDRFVVGAGAAYGVGASGGSSSVTLSTSQLPSHNHPASSTASSSVNDPGHFHSYIDQYVVINAGYRPWPANNNDCQQRNINTGSKTTGITVSTSVNTTINNTGGGQSHENRPPYYALCYIMKT